MGTRKYFFNTLVNFDTRLQKPLQLQTGLWAGAWTRNVSVLQNIHTGTAARTSSSWSAARGCPRGWDNWNVMLTAHQHLVP